MEAATADRAILCEACGDYPVPHRLTYFGKSLDVWQNDRMQALERSPSWSRLFTVMRAGGISFAPVVVRILHAMAGARTRRMPSKGIMDRSLVIWQEALRRGIDMEQLVIFGQPLDWYRARLRGRWIYFQSIPIPAYREAQSFPWADDKFLLKRFMQRHGIPVAKAAVAKDLEQAIPLLEALAMPVVVKPRLGSNSRHTTPLVTTLAQFDEAFMLARQLCKYVLFEEHLYGELCRATVVDGKLVGFLESRRPTVLGDGVRTILDLVREKNARKHERVSDIIFTDENAAFIGRQGYALDSIPEKGASVELARLPGRSSGGSNREMLDTMHPRLRHIVEQAATQLQAPLVGFDLIIPDASADPDNQKWGILEANMVPFIDIHYDPLYGTPSNVAAAVWDLWK